jgi:hypothetical protein
MAHARSSFRQAEYAKTNDDAIDKTMRGKKADCIEVHGRGDNEGGNGSSWQTDDISIINRDPPFAAGYALATNFSSLDSGFIAAPPGGLS